MWFGNLKVAFLPPPSHEYSERIRECEGLSKLLQSNGLCSIYPCSQSYILQVYVMKFSSNHCALHCASCCTAALAPALKLHLVGPFDVLAGKFHVPRRANGAPNCLLHYRYYYDPPELMTVLKGEDDTLFHMGYFR